MNINETTNVQPTDTFTSVSVVKTSPGTHPVMGKGRLARRYAAFLAIVVGSVLTAAGLTACSAPKSPPALTIAVTGTSSEPAPALSPALIKTVTTHALNALNPGDGVVTVVVQGRQPVKVDLTPMRGDQVETNATTATRDISAKLPALLRAMDAGAATPGLDTLGVLDQAIQVTPTGGTIDLITSGISTINPTDLDKAGAWETNPTTFINRIDPAGIPNGTGHTISINGLGYANPGGKQPSADTATRTALDTLWSGICHKTGAACTITDGPVGTTATTATNIVPVVTFPDLSTPCVATTIAINTDTAFAPGSAQLTAAADTQLAPIAAMLKTCPTGMRINATGHTATVPGEGNGITLSQARATAVLNRLTQLGAPASTIGAATGDGNITDQPVNNMPAGHYDENLAKRNRVVDLTLAQ
ncbi:OmpA family protein [Rudaeicoccus suwonensis]|uniref:OmpA family protein n=1 Tax=Rudaeicoccus suwonensis TaxID=657409 RepID=A0A561DVK3_9MICO|nr:OmpA family protein [Rudaeicoccus suwonensis]TWE07389.1 OmpA family protein [Rudaeicoccus suwonensis]